VPGVPYLPLRRPGSRGRFFNNLIPLLLPVLLLVRVVDLTLRLFAVVGLPIGVFFLLIVHILFLLLLLGGGVSLC